MFQKFAQGPMDRLAKGTDRSELVRDFQNFIGPGSGRDFEVFLGRV